MQNSEKRLHLQSQQRGTIAQSVEQRTENPCVAGSNPAGTTAKRPDINLAFFFLQKSAKIQLTTNNHSINKLKKLIQDTALVFLVLNLFR